ncbi:MAG: glycosyltransferase [Planctomycetota bacterium]|jgi:glycosyltransferase involved in cell wall biosynthesis|nr:glycosyltransferase [Planctomycetota bacterium]
MIIHLIHHPVSAKRFVEPIVKSLNNHRIAAELWVENRRGMADFVAEIECPKRFAEFDLSVNPFRVLARLVQMVRAFGRSRPTAIHAHQTRAAFIPLLAAVIARVPVRIYHVHGTPYLGYHGLLRIVLWMLDCLNCRLATHVIAVSHSIRCSMFRHRVVSAPKCRVLGEGSSFGICLQEFSRDHFLPQRVKEVRKELGISQHAYVVLYVGRPFRRKGFHTILDVWQRMGEKDRDVLLVAGCTSADVAIAAGHPMRSVKALGYMRDIRMCYAACDVVVLPSRHEGMPYSLLEGAAAGRPLVGSDIPGIDSIIDASNGVLVPPGDCDALLAALVKLRDDFGLRRRMGQSGRQLVERYFDRMKCERLLLTYYFQLGVKAPPDKTTVIDGRSLPAGSAGVCGIGLGHISRRAHGQAVSTGHAESG